MRVTAFWPTFVPLAMGACVFVIGRRFVDRTLPGADRLRRVLAATTLVLGLLELSSRALAAIGRFRATWLLAALGTAAAIAELILRRPGATGRSDRTPRATPCWSAATPAMIVGAFSVMLALIAARALPIWAWDAVGYHLPFVNYLVQSGSSAAVPDSLPYLGTYPHGAEILYAVLRLALPDDTWLDAAQVPFGIVGAVATVGIARRWGAPPAGALVAGAAWLSVPAVFLQLPSGYVDVCVASFLLLSVYWILDAPSPLAISLAGVSLGLLLASKPSAPLPVALLCGWLGVRSTSRRVWLAASLAIVCVLGLPDYLTNLCRFGNPWWPISLHLGPLHLPGRVTRAELLAAGAHAPRITGPLWSRVLRSWSALRAPASFDMRIGGLGAATVLLGIPGALWRLPARPAAMVALLASLAGPDPATARFVLAFPALCLALAATVGARMRPAAFAGLSCAVALLGALDLAHAAPSLTGEGPPLRRILGMSEEERLRSVGPDGRPDRWIDLRRTLAPGEAIAFDESFKLSYLLWRRRLENRVLSVPDTFSVDQVQDLVKHGRVRFLIAGERTAAGALVRRRGYRRLFACGFDQCAVYETGSSTGPSS